MQNRYIDWKKGLFYMETCWKPNILVENNPPIKVRWDELRPPVRKKIEMAQKAIMENAIRLRLDELKVDFKKRYNSSENKKRLFDNELSDLGFVLFDDNSEDVERQYLPDETIQYKLKNNAVFASDELRLIRNYIKQTYLYPHPDANPDKSHLFFHSEAIRKITSPALPPFAFAAALYDYYRWLETNFNPSVSD